MNSKLLKWTAGFAFLGIIALITHLLNQPRRLDEVTAKNRLHAQTPVPSQEERSVLKTAIPFSDRKPAASVPARPAPAARQVLTYAEKAAVVEDPELREYAVRQITKDYSELFLKLGLSNENEEALSKLLVDRMLAPNFSERAEYDALASKLLSTEEYAQFAGYRDDMPKKYMVRSAMTALSSGLDKQSALQIQPVVDSVVRAAPHNGDPLWLAAGSKAQQGVLTEADFSAMETVATQRFETVLSNEGAKLSHMEKQRLRDWFQKNIVQFNLMALRNARKPEGGG